MKDVVSFTTTIIMYSYRMQMLRLCALPYGHPVVAVVVVLMDYRFYRELVKLWF